MLWWVRFWVSHLCLKQLVANFLASYSVHYPDSIRVKHYVYLPWTVDLFERVRVEHFSCNEVQKRFHECLLDSQWQAKSSHTGLQAFRSLISKALSPKLLQYSSSWRLIPRASVSSIPLKYSAKRLLDAQLRLVSLVALDHAPQKYLQRGNDSLRCSSHRKRSSVFTCWPTSRYDDLGGVPQFNIVDNHRQVRYLGRRRRCAHGRKRA